MNDENPREKRVSWEQKEKGGQEANSHWDAAFLLASVIISICFFFLSLPHL